MPNRSLTPLTCLSRMLAFAVAMLPALAQSEPLSRAFCVWDPVGAGGPVSSLVKNMIPKALSWGVQLKLDVYTDEKIAATDFRAGVCDAVVTTDLSVSQFNHFTGSFSAVGAIPGNDEFRTLLTTITSPKAAPLMREGEYEIGGVFPIGSVFIYVRDREINTVEKLQGKKMAVLNNDPVIASMVRRVGGSVVPSSLHSMAGQFNNGSVDIIFAPAVAYNVMELYHGLEQGGGIINFPLLQTSMQITLRHARFPADFGQHMREYSLSKLDNMMQTVNTAESEIPGQHWIEIANQAQQDYRDYLRTSRLALRDEGLYQPKALSVLRKVRCKHQPSQAECTTKEE